jgi:hypothetical protein
LRHKAGKKRRAAWGFGREAVGIRKIAHIKLSGSQPVANARCDADGVGGKIIGCSQS